MTQASRGERGDVDDARYYAAFGMLEDEMVMVSDADRRIVFVSPSVEHVLGYSRDEFQALSNPDIIHPDDLHIAVEQASVLRRAPGTSYRATLRLLRADGSWCWTDIIGRNLLDDPVIAGVVQTIRDVTERHALEEELRRRATVDGLTGLANRDELERVLAELLATAGDGAHATVGLVFFDVDRFKVVNDSLGHHAGDDLLVRIADCVRQVTRPGDLGARFGGDELVVVRAGIDVHGAVALAESLRSAVAGAVGGDTGLPDVTLSVGVAVAAAGVAAADLLRDADAALYEAKRAGRDQVRAFDPGLRARAVAEHVREQAARRAAHLGDPAPGEALPPHGSAADR